jgi:hypothetical protein
MGIQSRLKQKTFAWRSHIARGTYVHAELGLECYSIVFIMPMSGLWMSINFIDVTREEDNNCFGKQICQLCV